MSVLFKALQRAEQGRAGAKPEAGADGPAGMPVADGGDPAAGLRHRFAGTAGDAAKRPSVPPAPLSMGRRVGRAVGILLIGLLAAVAGAMAFLADDIEQLLVDSLSPPVAPRHAAAPPGAAPATSGAAAGATEAEGDRPAGTVPGTETPVAPKTAPDRPAATTNIAALMDEGRRARAAREAAEAVPLPAAASVPPPPAEAVAPPPPPAPRSLEDVLAARRQATEAAPLRPTVVVDRPDAMASDAPAAEVEVHRQTMAARDTVAVAYAALMRGDYHAALASYDAALESDPAAPAALLGRAATLHKMRRLDEAQAAYEAVLGVEPNNREALTNLAEIMALAAPEAALRQLTALYRKAPDFGPVCAQLALLHARLGTMDQAVAFMRRATAVEPGNTLYRFNLAVLLDHTGDRKGAVAAYRQVLVAMGAGATLGISREDLRERLRYLTSPLR
jgi:tetratricopeptide (TPR) repeat protein